MARSSPPPVSGSGIEITLRLVPNEVWMRQCYDEYAGDVAWYRENDQLDPKNPDPGYRTGDPGTYEEYRDDLVAEYLEEVIATSDEPGWHLERVDD